MGKYVLKTQINNESVIDFLSEIEALEKRKDCEKILDILSGITQCEPKMWGKSIIGFDSYHYKYASGQEGDWPMIGFSPRKQNISIYIMPGYDNLGDLLKKLGPHKLGKSCLYIRRLSDIDLDTLQKIMKKGYNLMKEKYS